MKLSYKQLRFLYLAVFATLLCIACENDDESDMNSQDNVNRNDNSSIKALNRLEFPNTKDYYVLVHSTNEGINYSVLWDISKKAQRCSSYQMVKSRSGSYEYSFQEDPDLPVAYRLADSYSYYRGSGFDRGHICPKADRNYSSTAFNQTCYYTNMQPQYHMFNAGPRLANGDQDWSRKSPWLRLEEKIRSWAENSTFDTLYVTKGGTIDDDQILMKIKGELRVPKYFFVAVLGKTKTGYRAIGFWIEHDNKDHADDALSKYACNIRELEQNARIDFFCNLPDNIENRVEMLPIENVKKAWGI